MDYTRLVFDRLNAAGPLNVAGREGLYTACRTEVAAAHADAGERARALDALEKVIRRQEMQAIYEETLDRR